MMFFRKEKSSCVLTKLYFCADTTSAVDLGWLKEKVFSRCIGAPVEYSLNYAQGKPISHLTGPLTFETFEAFGCFDVFGRVVCSLGRASRAFGDEYPGVLFECFVVGGETMSFQAETDMLSNFAEAFDLQYAYVRRLPADLSPVSETKITTGLFGKSVKVGLIENTWLCDPAGLSTGAIKGFYPVNFWKSSVSTKLKELGVTLAPNAGKHGIVKFDQSELAKISKDNSFFRRFIAND